MGIKKKVQNQCVSMPIVAWQLLGQYLTVVCYDRRFRDGKSNVSYTVLIGSILSRWLIDNAEGIRRAANEVRFEAAKGGLDHFWTPAQLAAIASATGTDIPNVWRIGNSLRGPARSKAQARRAISLATRGPTTHPSRSPRKPTEVRARGGGAGTRLSLKSKENKRTKHSRG